MSPKWIDREGLGKCRTETRQLLNYNWGENKRIAYRGGQPELRFACSFKIGICFSWSKRVKQKIMNMYNSVTIHKIEDAFNLFQTCQVSRIRHRSPSLPYRSPYLPDKIIFWAFLCLVWNLEHFLTQNVNFSYSHYGFWGILHILVTDKDYFWHQNNVGWEFW